MLFREATIEDIPQMHVVRMSVKENVLNNPALVTEAHYMGYLTVHGKGWVCEVDDIIAGFAIVDVKEHSVWALFVHPDVEGKGIGRQLHQLMLDWYFSHSQTTLWLSTAPGTRAEGFYKRLGWKDAGAHGKGEVKLEMEREEWVMNRE